MHDTSAQRRTPSATPRAAVVIVILTAVAVGGLLASRGAYIPVWDGLIYADCITAAGSWLSTPSTLRCAGHASHVYMAFMGIASAIGGGGFVPILIANALLLVVAAVGFHRLTRLAFPESAAATDRALLTAAFAAQPSLLAAVVQPGLDLPLVPAFVWCTVYAIEKRWAMMIATGTALVFIKETGVLLYGALLGCLVVWEWLCASGRARERLVVMLKHARLVVPLAAFGLYVLYRVAFGPAGEPAVWNAGTAMIGQSLVRQLLIPRIDRYLASYLAMALVLNFAWILTLVIGAGAISATVRMATSSATRPARALVHSLLEALRTVPGFLTLLALATGYLLTRFATYANSRYLLPVIALLPIVAYFALRAIPTRPVMRRAVLVVYPLLLLVSAVRTVDPLSRAVYGTFTFGERQMLRMTSITRECCGHGRDQLVYSLEFTALERVTNDALAAIAPGDSTLIVLPDSTNWFFIGRIDPATNRRTLDAHGAIVPLVVEADSAAMFVGQRPRVYYLALPNGSPRDGLAELSNAFQPGVPRRFVRSRYSMAVYPLAPRSP